MDDVRDERRAAAVAAFEAGHYAEAYRLSLPLAEAGDAEAMAHVGSLMQCSLHRFENSEQVNVDYATTIDVATAEADQEQAGRYLEAASAAGIGAASFNLAGMYVMGYGGGAWAQRKAKAADLYTLAYEQGFTPFAYLTQGGGPGQPYLDMMERYAVAAGIEFPGDAVETDK